jgi:uncharacterized protein (TIGR02757 family)
MDPLPLKNRLDQLYQAYNCVNAATDPIEIVRRYTVRSDREVVGFVAASLAFGRVASVLQSIERVLQVLGPSPAEFVRRFEPARDSRRLKGIVHRWTRGVDLAALLWITRVMLEHGSIEAFFLEGSDSGAPDVGKALESFSTRARSVDLRPVYGRVPPRPGVQYFFPRPSAGSGCKRLNLFLRWMVRRDEVDLGVWSRLSPSKLVVPLDTHVIRVGRCLGLTTRKSPGWQMATEITASLRALDPADPVKYDFSLCHIGMANACSFNHQQGDGQCPLAGHCAPRRRSATRSRKPSASHQPSARR